ncbi:hypothetical protein SpCBS45565_g08241 [Spizellomyces sp. 'palustris']|nr:hypothetical protein SpCBS45565_g08241 [Spizellomyces sp. 'palustris']
MLETAETVDIRLHAADLLEKLPHTVPHRTGNWTEESVLREEKMRAFLTNYEKGMSNVKKGERRAKTARKEQILSHKLVYDANIMLKNGHTQSHLSADIPDSFPDNITPSTTLALTTCATETSPTARSCFQLVKLDAHGNTGESVPRFGERFYMVVTSDLVDAPMYLTSEPKSFLYYAKLSKDQAVYLTFNRDYRSVWQFDFPDPNFRLEMEGQDVAPNTPVLIKHCNTGNYLSSDKKYGLRTDFGVEWEVACHTYKDYGTRLELDQNHWLLRVSE